MKTLKIKTKLRSNTLKIANSKNLIGKEVEITIKEVKKNKVKKNWKHSASVDLKGKADKINIRDLAYE
ncbi:MAG: hypothetical protein KBF96_01175 [Ignavibacteria bacterium]|jgi:sRNA-binding carbon storage regulator CsrA|nr:hypothetical protein [Ignavibacteria bacterium]